jgi:cysteine desulfurase
MVGSIQPSHVLLAMGVPRELAQSTVRFSLGKQTTEADIAATVAALPRIAARMKK